MTLAELVVAEVHDAVEQPAGLIEALLHSCARAEVCCSDSPQSQIAVRLSQVWDEMAAHRDQSRLGVPLALLQPLAPEKVSAALLVLEERLVLE